MRVMILTPSDLVSCVHQTEAYLQHVRVGLPAKDDALEVPSATWRAITMQSQLACCRQLIIGRQTQNVVLRVAKPRDTEPQPFSSPLALFERRLHAPIHSSDAKWRWTIFFQGDLLRGPYRHWRCAIPSTIYIERVGPCR